MQISVSRAGPYGTVAAKNGPSGSAYITYKRAVDARRCIETIHGAVWEGAAALLSPYGPCMTCATWTAYPLWEERGKSMPPCHVPPVAWGSCACGVIMGRRSSVCRACARAAAAAGKAMKACFGTTKYCNAFLKGLVCNNAECLYLHEVGGRSVSQLSVMFPPSSPSTPPCPARCPVHRERPCDPVTCSACHLCQRHMR